MKKNTILNHNQMSFEIQYYHTNKSIIISVKSLLLIMFYLYHSDKKKIIIGGKLCSLIGRRFIIFIVSKHFYHYRMLKRQSFEF